MVSLFLQLLNSNAASVWTVFYCAWTFWAKRGPGLLVKTSHGAGEKLRPRPHSRRPNWGREAAVPAGSGGVLGGASLGRTAPVSALGAEASPSPPCMVLNIKDLIAPEPAGTGPESRKAAKTHSSKQGVPVKGLDG